MKMTRILLIITLLAISIKTYSQLKRIGIPYIESFNVTEHYASAQNWSSAMDSRGIMYFANNYGILIYDGANWEIVPVGHVSKIAIDPATDSVYVGASNDFGVLRNNEEGSYEYHSYSDELNNKELKFGDVKNIAISPGGGVIFQGTKYLFIRQGDSIKSINGDVGGHGFTGMFASGNRIFVSHIVEKIRELKDGQLTELPHSEPAKGMLKYIGEDNGRIILVNSDRGVYILSDTSCQPAGTAINSILPGKVTCAIRTHDGNYIFGTQRDGLIATDSEFNIIKQVDIISGGIKTNVNDIYEDMAHNIWVCTNNDIKLVDLYSPFSIFPNNATGISGSIKSVLQVGDNLYIGADAVYHTKISDLRVKPFTEIVNKKGLNGIWSLDTINGKIIGGGELGIFQIDSLNNLTSIDNDRRNARMMRVPAESPNLMITTGNLGLSLYEYDGQNWHYKKGIAGFEGNGLTRFIEQIGNRQFVIGDKNKGIYKITLNETMDTVISVFTANCDKGLPNDNDNYILKPLNRTVLSSIDGFYKFDGDTMTSDTVLNRIFGGKKNFDLLYSDGQGNIWTKEIVKQKRGRQGKTIVNEWFLQRYHINGDSVADCETGPFYPYKSHIFSFGYIGGGCYIIGDKTQFVHYDSKIHKEFQMPYKALIRKIENNYTDSLIYGGNETGNRLLIPYDLRSVRISFSAAFYEHPEDITYNTYLENNDDNWSGFRSENFKEYANLRPGKYIMHVQARNCYNNLSEEATITFTILPPWYLTTWAIILYVVIFGLLIWLFIHLYTQKLKSDNQKLEHIVQERTAEIREKSQLIMAQNTEIVQKNKSITDSINYAKHIQNAMLPLNEKISAVLPDHFILFRPKDIVSGDYYWFADTDKYIIITAADCTGHGVPGAFMSMIGSQILTEIVADGITSPDEILTNQNRRIRKALKQDTTDNHDGMDMALCTINKETHEVEYAGAKNQLVVIQKGELTEYKADKQGIGGNQMYGDDFQYKKTSIIPDGNTWFYMFSDGYKDQFGGPDNSKFLIKNLRKLLMDIHDEKPEKQREILDNTIQKWIDDGKGEQTDDIILMGFKL